MKKYLIPILVVLTLATVSIAGARLLQKSGHLPTGDPNGSTVLNDPDTPSPDKGSGPDQNPTPSKNSPPGQNQPPNQNQPPDQNPPPDQSLPPAQNLPPGETQPPAADPDPALQDRTVFSWWFERNNQHLPPRFDAALVAAARDRDIYLGDTTQKTIYLTFDEGYENGFTPQILDVLKANGVPAAFFVTADFANKNPELVQQIAAAGHLLGNHTTTHPSLPALTNAEIRTELKTAQEKVYDLTGVSMAYMRPPMGEFNRRVLDVAAGQGFKTVFWSMAYRDWETDHQPGKDAALKHVIDNLHPGAVILLHAVSQSNTEALDDIIKGIKAKGYSFGRLTDINS